MLKYFNDNYKEGRTPIDTKLFEDILRETLRITSSIDTSSVDFKKAIFLFFASINYYFYLHPEQYVDFGKFIAYRSFDTENLITVEACESETAESIYTWLKQGGLEREELRELVKSYSEDLLTYSENRIEDLTKDINKISNFVSQDEMSSNNKHKEKENGI